MNDTDPHRLTTAIGIEPYLERVFVFGDLPIARVLVLMSLAIWSLVLVTFLFTTLYRYILLKLLTDRDRRLLESHGRPLRRLAQHTRLSGYVTLLVTFVVAMLFLQSGVRHAVQALIWGALSFLGVALPTSLIADLFGRMFESRGPMEGKR